MQLLLEHLECLVSRHERSLRMTVVKRQAQSPAGVSSEVEVLKALKSLFEHHKALDEKVRERLRITLEKVSNLEEELSHSNEELNKSRQMQLQQQQQIESLTMASKLRYSGDDNEKTQDSTKSVSDSTEENKRAANDDTSSTSLRLSDLQTHVEKQSNEILSFRNRVVELTAKLKDYEDRIVKSDKEVSQLKEENVRLSRDLKENIAQKEDQEERITTLEKRYLNAQRESTTLHDLNEKLQRDLVNKEAQLRMLEDKVNSLNEEIRLLSEADSSKKKKRIRNRIKKLIGENDEKLETDGNDLAEGGEDGGSDDDDDSDLDSERKRTYEEKLLRFEQQLEEKSIELTRARQREKMNEDHNQRLSATVDKLLAESNERLQLHLKERMSALEDKNTMNQELERIRKLLDETQLEKGKILQELSKMRIELESSMSAQNNGPSAIASRFHSSFLNHTGSPISSPLSDAASLSTAKYVGSPSSSTMPVAIEHSDKVDHNSASPKDWDKRLTTDKKSPQSQTQKSILLGENHTTNNSARIYGATNYKESGNSFEQRLERDIECCSQMTGESNPFDDIDHQLDQIISSSAAVIAQPHHHINHDPQTLAIMLQEQLDAINNEIRLIQEEKQSTEQRAEELESQVGSIDSAMNKYLTGTMPSFSGNYGVGLSPPQSGASTPKSSSMVSFMNTNQYYAPNGPYVGDRDFSQYASPYIGNYPDWNSNRQLSDQRYFIKGVQFKTIRAIKNKFISAFERN